MISRVRTGWSYAELRAMTVRQRRYWAALARWELERRQSA